MRLNVYIFGDGRAAPTNYLHVRANPLLVDWDNWLFDDSYNQSITVAANEAGGQAFATDYAMPTGPVPDALRPRAYDLALLRSMPTPWDFVNALGAAGFENTPALGQILEGHLPIPEDFPATISDIISCAWCYADDLPDGPFDLDATVDALDADIVMPEQNLYALWNDSRYLTRLRSSVSPEEMTVDPSFHVTDGLVDVPQVRNARMTYLCARSQDHTVPPGKVRFAEYAPRRTVFPGGYETVLPPEVWMQARGLTDRDYLADLFSRSALVVEQIEVTGERVILEDHRARLRRVLGDESWNADAKTCGCTAVSGSAGVFGLPLLLLLATRRRDDLRPAEMDG